MIYFETLKHNKRQEFIEISTPGNKGQLNAYFRTRRNIFCEEQKIFQETDYDKYDNYAIPIIAVNHYMGSPDEVVGVVRIYETQKGEWFGGRLGVMPAYRSFTKFICPHLFQNNNTSALYQMSVAAGLIYRAVSLANYIGCHKFSAHVQGKNVKLFKRLHWNEVKEVTVHGVKHTLMEANLDAYPAAPLYTSAIVDAEHLVKLLKVA